MKATHTKALANNRLLENYTRIDLLHENDRVKEGATGGVTDAEVLQVNCKLGNKNRN